MKPIIPHPEKRSAAEEKSRARAAKVVKDIRRYNSDMPEAPALKTHKERVEWLKQANAGGERP